MSKNKHIADTLILGAVTLLACMLFLSFSYNLEGLGFPLDDSWIHHTFARNFSESSQWSFRAGELSGGSTGPGWGFLLVLIYWLKIPPVVGTYVLGFLLLWSTALVGTRLVSCLIPGRRYLALGAGIILALEWHLVWAALSGMETILFMLLSLIIFYVLISKNEAWWALGLLIGFSVWIRPDGLTLLGPAILSLLLRGYSNRVALKKGTLLLVGVLVVVSAYFIFNFSVAGDVWPNTFYAKQAEYLILRDTPLIERFLNLCVQLITGVGIILLPGFILQLKVSLKNRSWDVIGAAIWSIGYIGIYSWRLPVIYQHGRYIMPAMPICYIIGAAGLGYFLVDYKEWGWYPVIKRAWLISTSIILGIFLILGARSYGLDVAVINTEMVNTATWIDSNLEKDVVIAAHDIGALGYFTDQRIIDLAGLITPDVIPFIRDEKQLKLYLNEENTDYLMTFPGWYKYLTRDLDEVYTSHGKYSIDFGNENMAVFRWK